MRETKYSRAHKKVAEEKIKKKNDKPFKLGQLIAPFIALAFIPVVGHLVVTIGFIVLGLASLAHYIAEPKEKKKCAEEKESSEKSPLIGKENPQTKTQPENVRYKTQGKNQDGMKLIKRVDSTESKEETPPDTIKAKPKTTFSFRHCLPGSSWLEEDRRLRQLKAANEEMSLDNPISEPLSSSSEEEGVYEKKEYDLSGYESFPDIEESSDSEEEEHQKGGGYIRTRKLMHG